MAENLDRLISALQQREADFRASAERYPRLRVTVSLHADNVDPMPCLIDHVPPHGGAAIDLGGRPEHVVAARFGLAGWRVRRQGEVHYGPPPQHFKDGVKVTDPDSPYPKPWGYFFADNPDQETCRFTFTGPYNDGLT